MPNPLYDFPKDEQPQYALPVEAPVVDTPFAPATNDEGQPLKKVDPEKLGDYIGKEAAKKLLEQEKHNGAHTLQGEDLKIGGEGMKGFYDQIIPKALEKIGKEHGVKVKQGSLPGSGGYKIRQATDGAGGVEIVRDGKVINVAPSRKTAQEWIDEQGGASIHYIDIPQSMKDAALRKGQPLFSNNTMFTPVDFDPWGDDKNKK